MSLIKYQLNQSGTLEVTDTETNHMTIPKENCIFFQNLFSHPKDFIIFEQSKQLQKKKGWRSLCSYFKCGVLIIIHKYVLVWSRLLQKCSFLDVNMIFGIDQVEVFCLWLFFISKMSVYEDICKKCPDGLNN